MPMRLLRCVMPSTAARNLNCPILKLDDISSWASPLEHHLTGLLNGLSIGSDLNLWGLPTPVNREQLFYWMDQYCANNPLKALMEGAVDFAIERRGAAWADSFKQ